MPSSDWYRKRFAAGAPAPAPVSEMDAPRSYPTAPPTPAQPSQHITQRPALSSLQTDHCPACASGNYMAAPGTQSKRCFDCGYPVQQAGSGLGTVNKSKTVHKATQVEGAGFNPSVIIGRVE